MVLTNETDDEYDELVLDLYSITRDCGITINTTEDVCINYEKFENLNATVWLKVSIHKSIHNDVLFNNPSKLFGNVELKLIMLK